MFHMYPGTLVVRFHDLDFPFLLRQFCRQSVLFPFKKIVLLQNCVQFCLQVTVRGSFPVAGQEQNLLTLYLVFWRSFKTRFWASMARIFSWCKSVICFFSWIILLLVLTCPSSISSVLLLIIFISPPVSLNREFCFCYPPTTYPCGGVHNFLVVPQLLYNRIFP